MTAQGTRYRKSDRTVLWHKERLVAKTLTLLSAELNRCHAKVVCLRLESSQKK